MVKVPIYSNDISIDDIHVNFNFSGNILLPTAEEHLEHLEQLIDHDAGVIAGDDDDGDEEHYVMSDDSDVGFLQMRASSPLPIDKQGHDDDEEELYVMSDDSETVDLQPGTPGPEHDDEELYVMSDDSETVVNQADQSPGPEQYNHNDDEELYVMSTDGSDAGDDGEEENVPDIGKMTINIFYFYYLINYIFFISYMKMRS